jgi:signal transduction histidine kinase
MIQTPTKIRKRIETLFLGLENLAIEADDDAPSMPIDIECLPPQVLEREADLQESEKYLAPQESPAFESEAKPERHLAAPSFYEADYLGYAYTGDKVEPLHGSGMDLHAQNGAMSIPLIAGGQDIGELRVAPSDQRAWTPDENSMAQSVAQQVSLQVQNLRLLSATERARAEAEAANRRFIRGGWESYLDAIQQSERVGYTYDRSSVAPFTEKLPDASGFKVPLEVINEQIGALYLKTDPDHPLSKDDEELVAAIARQITQQVENLRLLSDAARARTEAEEATRLLTRQSWKDFTGRQTNNSLAFKYDSVRVSPMADSALPQEINFKQPLTVRGETIGHLAVAGCKEVTPDSVSLASAIAAQASIHIENLRLFEETELGRQQLDKRAAELETVARVSTAAATILSPQELAQSVTDLTKASFNLYHTEIYLLEEQEEKLYLIAGSGEIGQRMALQEHKVPLSERGSILVRTIQSKAGVVSNDLQAEPDYRPNLLLPDTKSEMALPMIVGDKVLGVIAFLSDHTKRFSEEDMRIYNTLASQVAVAIQNANLYSEQMATVERLRELDQLKTSFLANMSHELRTPLNSILGFTQLILEGLEGPLTEGMEGDLQLIHRNGQHLLNLINDVLDMAKIEAGRVNLVLEPTPPEQLITEVIEITGTLAKEKSLYLRQQMLTDEPIVLSIDRTRMRQVFINLVGNAVKFTETGGITIYIEKLEDKVQFRISDSGIGIPPNKLENIFEAFSQVDTSTTRKAGGTGLGLPISRRLVELHNGRLWAQSTGVNGEGSTFYLELPLTDQASPEVI